MARVIARESPDTDFESIVRPAAASAHLDPGAAFHQLAETEGVPICEADATTAFIATDAVGRVRAMHPDARAVDSHPDNADRAVGTGREVVGVVAAHAGFEDGFVPAEIRHQDVAGHTPCAERHGKLRGARRAGKAPCDPVVLIQLDQTLVAQKNKPARRCGGWLRDRTHAGSRAITLEKRSL